MYTKTEVVAERKCGLKKFDEAKAQRSIDLLIEDGIEYARKDNMGAITDPWAGFSHGFNNAWRNACKKHYGGSASINLDEMLSLEQMEYIAGILKITQPYQLEWRRKGSPYNRDREGYITQ